MNAASPSVRSIEEIAKVPDYGKRFPLLPRKQLTKVKVALLFSRHLFRKVGLFPYLGFWLALPFRLPGLVKENKKGLQLMGDSFSGIARLQWTLLIAIYQFLAKREGKEAAYQFAKDAIQDASRFMMNEFYQADELAKFEDPYLAFWEYHKAMFQEDPNFENELIEGEDCHKMIVHNCRSCAIAQMTVPELAPLGCDHDITGFEAIADKIQMDFRRPTTLAKDGKPCQFLFYRKGTAPEGLETK